MATNLRAEQEIENAELNYDAAIKEARLEYSRGKINKAGFYDVLACEEMKLIDAVRKAKGIIVQQEV